MIDPPDGGEVAFIDEVVALDLRVLALVADIRAKTKLNPHRRVRMAARSPPVVRLDDRTEKLQQRFAKARTQRLTAP